jgi:hypothetical protein
MYGLDTSLIQQRLYVIEDQGSMEGALDPNHILSTIYSQQPKAVTIKLDM